MPNAHDSTYLFGCQNVLTRGRQSSDRTGTGTTKLPGLSMRFNMDQGFPLLTSKFTSMRIIEKELRMFLNGITNNKFLADDGINIWTPFAAPNGDLGPIYGAMWRNWTVKYGDGTSEEIDQIANLMDGLRNNPMSRRHIVSGWNPALLPIEGRSHAQNVISGYQALPPCHTMWQVHVCELTIQERFDLSGGAMFEEPKNDVELATYHAFLDRHNIPRYGVSLQLYQRSADMFLGVPFNIASYSLLLHYIANTLNMKPMEFIWNGGDCHIYNDHVEQVQEQFSRMNTCPASPEIRFKNKRENLWDYTADDFEIVGYDPMPAIKGKMAV
jgi:thymidylate synthase